MPVVDEEQKREALARLERDYLRGALPAEDYQRLRGALLDEGSPVATQMPAGVPGAVSPPSFPPGSDPVTGAHLSSWGGVPRPGLWTYFSSALSGWLPLRGRLRPMTR